MANDISQNKNFLRFRDAVVVWGVCPGTKWYWPSAAFFVGMWVSFALVLLSVQHDLWTILFALGCLLGAALNFLVFWYCDRLFVKDRERCRKIRAGWGSQDLSIRYSDWRPI